MRRNCAKLGTLVGTFPTSSPLSSSIACYFCKSSGAFARTVSSAHGKSAISLVSSCQCSSSAGLGKYDANSDTNNASRSLQDSPSSDDWKPQQCSLKVKAGSLNGGGGGAGVGLSKSPSSFLPPLFHARRCSTSPSAARISLYSTKRTYCSKADKNAGLLSSAMKMMDVMTPSASRHNPRHNHSHLQQNNNDSDNNASSFLTNNNNAQAQWVSHQQSSSNSDYCSTIIIDNKHKKNNLMFSSSPISSSGAAASGGRATANGCGNSISSGSNGPSPSSSSSTPTSTVFGMIANGSGGAGTSNFTSVRTVVTSQRLVEFTRDSIMEQPKLMSKEEREEFMSVYHQLVKELLEIPDMKDMEETNRWMARVLQYNVPHGKRNRGLSTALAYKYLAPEELTEENVRLSYVLGWCVEILQAYFLVSDDIMDGSETRRGRPCWYKVDNLGLAAVNDAILLEATIYAILRKHFSDKPYYARVMEVMHDVTYKTIFGQSLDTRTGQDRRMETYTVERYSSIVKYKTSYYSFYLPVALAMTMAELTDPNLFQQMRKVTLEMGHFFQVQDDYLDCFGDEEVTGKIGTDIQDCKCSWMFVVAMQACSPEQKKILMDNYGKHNPEQIAIVKKLYRELDMETVYNNYEEQTYNMICTHIQQMSDQLPKGLFYDMLHKIYKRSS